MKRSFKESLLKDGSEYAGAERGEKSAEPRGPDNTAGAAETPGELIKKYSGMSESELMRELKAATDMQKADGSFDRSALRKGAEAILPMLGEAQRKKLDRILSGL